MLAIVLVVLAVLFYTVVGSRGIGGIKAALLIMGNVYNMLFLVVLLAYGLFNLPIYLWKYADNKHSLYSELEYAYDIRKGYRDA